MTRPIRCCALLLLLFAVISGAGVTATATETAAAAVAEGVRYVCPPCGSPCDTASFSAPGVCPICGMTLIEVRSGAAKAVAEPDRKRVAILLFNGVEVLDFAGPYEMFGAAGCEVYTVAATKAPITTAMGLAVEPGHTFADAPSADVLVVPGGGVYGASRDEATLRYISKTAGAGIVMSVCNGAFILARAGLLDGLAATTTYANIPKLAQQFPKIRVVSDQRYVDNGKIVTTAGLSAGLDGALHLIARLFGTGYAEDVALTEEYDWKPDGGFVRAALADHQLPPVPLDSLGKWDVVRTEGDRDRWDFVVRGHSTVAMAELMSRLESDLSRGRWTKVPPQGGSSDIHSSAWRFTGTDGKPWIGTLKLEPGDGTGHDCTAELSVSRAGPAG